MIMITFIYHDQMCVARSRSPCLGDMLPAWLNSHLTEIPQRKNRAKKRQRSLNIKCCNVIIHLNMILRIIYVT